MRYFPYWILPILAAALGCGAPAATAAAEDG
jgi:hypothetical protein